MVVLVALAFMAYSYRYELSALDLKLNELSLKIDELNSHSASKTDLASLASSVEKLNESLARVNMANARIASKIMELNRSIAEQMKLMAFPASVVDASGRIVVMNTRPERIVSLLPSCTETIFAVGAGPQVVGVDDQSNYPPELTELTHSGRISIIGSGWYPSIERILALRPDLVFGVSSVPSHSTVKAILARYGVPVALLPDKTVEDVLTSMYITGRLTGHTVRASEVAAKIRAELSNVAARVAEEKRTRVAMIVWASPIWVAGNDTWVSGLLGLAGGINAFSNVKGWSTVDPEALIKAKPDVIIYTAGNCSSLMPVLHGALGKAAMSVPAIASDRVYCVLGEYRDAMIRPGPRIALAAKLLSMLLHPGAYGLKSSSLPSEVSQKTLELKVVAKP